MIIVLYLKFFFKTPKFTCVMITKQFKRLIYSVSKLDKNQQNGLKKASN